MPPYQDDSAGWIRAAQAVRNRQQMAAPPPQQAWNTAPAPVQVRPASWNMGGAPSPAYSPPVQQPGTVPNLWAQVRDASIVNHGYGTPDGRGGYSSEPANGWTPISKQAIAARNYTGPYSSLAGSGHRNASVANLAAGEGVRSWYPGNQDFKHATPQDQWAAVKHRMDHPNEVVFVNGHPAPQPFQYQPANAQSMANWHHQESEKLAEKERQAATRLAWQQAAGRRPGVSGGAPGAPVVNFKLPPVPRDAQDRLAGGRKDLQDTLSALNRGVPQQHVLNVLRSKYNDQELEQLASMHSPGMGISDAARSVTHLGEPADVTQRNELFQMLQRLGIRPPGAKPFVATPPMTEDSYWASPGVGYWSN